MLDQLIRPIRLPEHTAPHGFQPDYAHAVLEDPTPEDRGVIVFGTILCRCCNDVFNPTNAHPLLLVFQCPFCVKQSLEAHAPEPCTGDVRYHYASFRALTEYLAEHN